MATPTPAQQQALTAIAAVVRTLDLASEQVSPTLITVTMPGTRKLRTECTFEVTRHGVEVRAFVARCPDENHAGVHHWLLERNLRLRLVAFAVDHAGDIYLRGRLPLPSVTEAAIDAVLGELASTADESFNSILELGFSTSIKAEWAWRRSRGESTANLAAFSRLDPERDARA